MVKLIVLGICLNSFFGYLLSIAGRCLWQKTNGLYGGLLISKERRILIKIACFLLWPLTIYDMYLRKIKTGKEVEAGGIATIFSWPLIADLSPEIYIGRMIIFGALPKIIFFLLGMFMLLLDILKELVLGEFITSKLGKLTEPNCLK